MLESLGVNPVHTGFTRQWLTGTATRAPERPVRTRPTHRNIWLRDRTGLYVRFEPDGVNLGPVRVQIYKALVRWPTSGRPEEPGFLATQGAGLDPATHHYGRVNPGTVRTGIYRALVKWPTVGRPGEAGLDPADAKRVVRTHPTHPAGVNLGPTGPDLQGC